MLSFIFVCADSYNYNSAFGQQPDGHRQHHDHTAQVHHPLTERGGLAPPLNHGERKKSPFQHC